MTEVLSDTELAARIAALPAPKVEPADLEAQIKSEHYFTGAEGVLGSIGSDGVPATAYEASQIPGALARTTICVLVLHNGIKLTGINHGPVSAENYDPEIGKTYARKGALQQLWPMLGYGLAEKQRLLNSVHAPSRKMAELGGRTHVGTKVIHAVPMFKGPYCALRGWVVPTDEDPNELGYLVEYTDGGAPNHADFAGYISWSPRHVFEQAYTHSGVSEPKKTLSRAERLQIEWDELDGKIQRAVAFCNSAAYDGLPEIEKKDLCDQLHHMKEYRWFLSRRKNRA